MNINIDIESFSKPFEWNWEAIIAIGTSIAALAAIGSLIFFIMQYLSENRPFLISKEIDLEGAFKDEKKAILINSGKRTANKILIEGSSFNKSYQSLHPGDTLPITYKYIDFKDIRLISYKRFSWSKKFYLTNKIKKNKRKTFEIIDNIGFISGKIKLLKFFKSIKQKTKNVDKIGLSVSVFNKETLITMRWLDILDIEENSISFKSDLSSSLFVLYKIFGQFKKGEDFYYKEMSREHFIDSLILKNFFKRYYDKKMNLTKEDINKIIKMKFRKIKWDNATLIKNDKDVASMSSDSIFSIRFVDFFTLRPKVNIYPNRTLVIGRSIFFFESEKAILEALGIGEYVSTSKFALFDTIKNRFIIYDKEIYIVEATKKVSSKFLELQKLIELSYSNKKKYFVKAKKESGVKRLMSICYWLFIWRPSR